MYGQDVTAPATTYVRQNLGFCQSWPVGFLSCLVLYAGYGSARLTPLEELLARAKQSIAGLATPEHALAALAAGAPLQVHRCRCTVAGAP